MQYRKMGNLGWDISALGFGTMRLASKRKFFWKTLDVEESVRIIRRGIDLGINYVDTAWTYHLGKSEVVLGKALEGGYREKVKIADKIPMILLRKKEDFNRYLTTQLERLQTDYLDVCLFHMLNIGQIEKVKKLGLIEDMEEAKASGLIKHIGFSFHDTLPVFKDIVDFYPWDMTLIQHNYMDTGIQATTEGVKYAHEKGMAVVIMEPLKGGALANPPKEALDVMANAENKRTPVDWALQFLWNLPEVSCVLSGMGSMQMVEENCASAENSGINSLNAADIKVIDELAAIYQRKILVPCTSCKYCMPCPFGVDIPFNFATLNNVSFNSNADLNQRLNTMLIKRRYNKMAKTKKALERKPNHGMASLCTNCKACIPKCPQQIDIPAELEKSYQVLSKGKKIRDVFGEKYL